MTIKLKVGTIVSVYAFHNNAARKFYNYVGVVTAIYTSAGDVVQDFDCIVGEGSLNSAVTVGVLPIFAMNKNSTIFDLSELIPIEEPTIHIENPHAISIITEDIYYEIRTKMLKKLNQMSELLFLYPEFDVEVRINKPKKIKLTKKV